MKIRRRLGCFGRLLIVLLIIIVLVIILLFDSNTRLVTTEYELHYDGLPGAFEGYRIVLLADIHGAEHGEDNASLTAAVKGANPDIIVIAGDLIDRFQPGNPVKKQIEIAETLVYQLVRIAPVYYVTGNHEWDSGEIHSLLAMLEQNDVTVLKNQYRHLTANGESIILAGVDDPGGPADMIKPEQFIERIHERENADFIIVISHRNYNLQLYSELGVDLILSGHAHGGMVRLPFTDGLVGPQYELFPTYTSGVYVMGDTNMAVSRGLGNHFGWTRFLNNPEVVVVELRG
ncbi:MAG: metallophosphoesterase [Oscillospiraceae bacterium]|jgi:predicted MPP superfamily phosphohydrolase|nr:metallophosphoesterase [Oscillospiraceae bacterium]